MRPSGLKAVRSVVPTFSVSVIALGHREDGNAAVVRLQARGDELDQRGRNPPAAEVERYPH